MVNPSKQDLYDATLLNTPRRETAQSKPEFPSATTKNPYPYRPNNPRPNNPRPNNPRPNNPQPSNPQPSNPQPSNPQPSNPRPSNPRPSNPQPSNPQPSNPRPSNPQPNNPQPSNLNNNNQQHSNDQQEDSTDSSNGLSNERITQIQAEVARRTTSIISLLRNSSFRGGLATLVNSGLISQVEVDTLDYLFGNDKKEDKKELDENRQKAVNEYIKSQAGEDGENLPNIAGNILDKIGNVAKNNEDFNTEHKEFGSSLKAINDNLQKINELSREVGEQSRIQVDPNNIEGAADAGQSKIDGVFGVSTGIPPQVSLAFITPALFLAPGVVASGVMLVVIMEILPKFPKKRKHVVASNIKKTTPHTEDEGIELGTSGVGAPKQPIEIGTSGAGAPKQPIEIGTSGTGAPKQPVTIGTSDVGAPKQPVTIGTSNNGSQSIRPKTVKFNDLVENNNSKKDNPKQTKSTVNVGSKSSQTKNQTTDKSTKVGTGVATTTDSSMSTVVDPKLVEMVNQHFPGLHGVGVPGATVSVGIERTEERSTATTRETKTTRTKNSAASAAIASASI